MVNITALNNMTAFVPNTSLINDTNQTIPNIVNNANTVTDGYWGLIIMVVLFLFLCYISISDSGIFRLDVVKSLVYASGCTLIVGVVMIASGLITSYRHVVWFAVLFTFSLIASFLLKKKGL